MKGIVSDCVDAGISPPDEAITYIEKYESGDEESLVHLRPQIDKGVSYRMYSHGKAVIIDLNEISEDIDIIRIYSEEYEE
jgi:hypothetical protein